MKKNRKAFKMWKNGLMNINKKTLKLFTKHELLTIAKSYGFVDEFCSIGIDTDTEEVLGKKELKEIISRELDL